MKVVVAIDSFKGSITSMQAAMAAKRGILAVKPDAVVVTYPLADGGEGTTDALLSGLGGEKITLSVTGPSGNPVTGSYGLVRGTSAHSKMAVMEMASASGLTLVPKKDHAHAVGATTRGVGEMIANAIRRGIRDFIIGIGGSATNDGGIGMLKALGYEFLDTEGHNAGEGAEALAGISRICGDDWISELHDCRFRVACDVKNPLCGPQGATYIYGPQKGLAPDSLESIDRGMANYAHVTEQYLRERTLSGDCSSYDFSNIPGAGAAGGLGFAFLSFLNAELVPGAELILDAIGIEEDIKDADVVITGEGCLDNQTVMGKAPAVVAKLAKKYGAKVIAFAGSVAADMETLYHAGFDACFSIMRESCTLEEAMKPENAMANLEAAAEQVFRLL